MNDRQEIVIVWLKRDLRLQDNEAIYNALQTGKKVLLLYVFENILLSDAHYSDRHWNFIKQSLEDLNTQLLPYRSKILSVQSDIEGMIDVIRSTYVVTEIFSHQETGLSLTFERDKKFARYTVSHGIKWTENINNGVIRGLKNRELWFENWQEYMLQKPFSFHPHDGQLLNLEEIASLERKSIPVSLSTQLSNYFQRGGTTTGLKYANSFFRERSKAYMFHISKPELSRTGCSRLSPYFAWGNLSIREIFQWAKHEKQTSKDKRHLSAFISRLRWQAHFIQKFEMECSMENFSVNKGYHLLKKLGDPGLQRAWETGQTGIPLVDASMRCLIHTGYVNFRMRAMLVSYFTHILWQPWQAAAAHLARLFLDFEPGIHFPQLQMQAGETGINNIRIYNPIKNGLEHDPEGVFVKKWVPELQNLPTGMVHEPYLMTALEQEIYNFKIGVSYPKPIVDLEHQRKYAAQILFGMKKNELVRRENLRILNKHTLKNRRRMLRDED